MKKNVGGIDKIIRIVVGLIIIVLGIYYNNWWGILGLAVLLTGLMSYCSLYRLFGISTKEEELKAPEEPKQPQQ